MVARRQFNTARAVDAFSAAIHWAVWDYVKERPDGRAIYRNFRRSCLAQGMAEELAAQFKQEVGPRSASTKKVIEIFAGAVVSFRVHIRPNSPHTRFLLSFTGEGVFLAVRGMRSSKQMSEQAYREP